MGVSSVDWRSVVDGFSDGVVIADGADRIVHVNAPAAMLFATEPERLVRAGIEQLVPERLRKVDGRPFHRWLLERGSAGEAPSRMTMLRSDGLELDVEVTASEARGDESEPLLVLVLRQMHEALDFGTQQAGSRTSPSYQLVFERAPLGLFHFDARGVLTACNERFVGIIGSPKRVLVGLSMTMLPNQGIVRCIEDAIAGRSARWEGDYQSATSGKVTPVRVEFTPIVDEATGAVAGGIGIVEDVTERRAAEQALGRAERMASLGTLAAGVAHEINNPLTYVMTSIDLAATRTERVRAVQDSPELEVIAASLANAHEGVERVRHIVRDLKTFVRSDDESPRRVDVEKVVESAIKLTWNEVRHRARLERDFTGVPPVWANEPRLVQVFVNLLANAAQAIVEGDVQANLIRVVTRLEGDLVRVEVQDTGLGIDAADVDRIFEPFWTQRPRGAGTGLGLSIVHGIVTSLGGAIEVESEQGRGSTFRVTLPRAEGAASERPPPPPEPESPREGRARILIVDDEVRLAQTMQIALRPDHDVEFRTRGSQAVELLTDDPDFDLILCDLMLPDTTGPDIYESLRDARPELLDRFVFMTGGAFTERSREFLRKVSNPRIEKPFHVDEVERLLRQRPQR